MVEKFRVWDKEEKAYQYFDINEASVPVQPLETGKKERFSGFQDLNGKDIYEDDFIRQDTDDEADDDFDPNEPIGVVRLLEDGWVVSDGTDKGGFYLEEFIDLCEVIGNIHENEEWVELLYQPPASKKPFAMKFRVFDSKNIIVVKKNSGYRLYFEGVEWELVQNGQVVASSTTPECRLIPFTGTIDAHGKEIYEGDIVRSAYTENEYKKKFPKKYKEYGFEIEDDFVGVVRYSEENAAWELEKPRVKNTYQVNFLICEVSQDWIEIAGNVYENNEILTTLQVD